ncbi:MULTISPECIES: PcfJ domain-containing protein [Clostridium]|uniref:PcfJ domain-containing protein n=1 Tax=Clostridium TaxID=1485 RepID=UPI000826D295|nr:MULTISPECIES: PcfJ domain-containing protein [Clostridium]PJI10230.1 hypothetical protein CUB90_21165 [Clostridium sp. CT7]
MRKVKLAEIKTCKLKKSFLIKFSETNIKYFISSQIINFDNDILMLCIYSKCEDSSKVELSYRVFIDKTKKDYITQDFTSKEIKWRKAILSNLLNWYWEEYSVLVDNKSTRNILKYFNVKEKPLSAVDDFQNAVLKEKLEKKHEIITKRIDEKMKIVPDLPDDFTEWVDEEALVRSRYIYYKYRRTNKAMEGYCTHCGKKVFVNKPRHNKEGICPRCKSKVIYKAEGKSKNVEDFTRTSIIQRVSGGIIIRSFSVRKFYRENYKKPQLMIHEVSRDFYEFSSDNSFNIKTYEWRNFKQTDVMRWCEGESSLNFDYSRISLYSRNLDDVLNNTIWKYSEIKHFATVEPGYTFPVYSYLGLYTKYPFIEQLMKLNLIHLVKDILGSYYSYGRCCQGENDVFNFNGKNIKNILKIDRKFLSLLQKLNAGISELKVIEEVFKRKINITNEEIFYIADKFYREKDIFDFATKYSITIHRIIKYISSQMLNYDEHSKENDIFSDWEDYLNNCTLLKYDIKSDSVIFPRNLKQKHDDIYKLIKNNKRELYDKAIKEMYNELLEKFKWNFGEYIIFPPKNAAELVKEGNTLDHCVATNYMSLMARRKTVILFLRKEDKIDMPFYTVEVKDNEVKQCRGKGNCGMTNEVKKFIEEFKDKKLRKTLNEKIA